MTRTTLRYLALGDSYTIGEGVDEQERWPNVLARRLRALGTPTCDPEIVATTGWTSQDLLRAISEARPQGPFSFVSLLIGVNNQYQGRGTAEYRRQYRRLLRQAIGFAGGDASRALAVSIPDWGVTPFAEGRDRLAIEREIDAFNNVGRTEAIAAGVCFVEITPLSRLQGALVVADGLHPDAAAYSAWVDLLLPSVRDRLELPAPGT